MEKKKCPKPRTRPDKSKGPEQGAKMMAGVTQE
jgi:hypothetical protein